MSSTDIDPLTIKQIIDGISNLKRLASDCTEKTNPPRQTTANRQDETIQSDENEKKTEALHELEKLCKELDYMIRSFQKLEEYEKSLKEPLKTLEDNVNDIVADLGKKELPKQVHHNLRVLRNNITRVKILIPVQHQTASLSSEGARALETTVATGDAGDLPHLYSKTGILQKSFYFKEIKDKYDGLDYRHQLCLLCFAIFPENAVIKKRFLRYWWVGENLIPPQGGKDEKGMLDYTLKTFEEKKLIEPVRKKNRLQPRSYKMNPIIRSCLIEFAQKNGFFEYDEEGKPVMDFSSCNKACMVKSEGATAPWFFHYLKGTENETKSKKPKEQQGEGEPQAQQGGGEPPQAQQQGEGEPPQAQQQGEGELPHAQQQGEGEPPQAQQQGGGEPQAQQQGRGEPQAQQQGGGEPQAQQQGEGEPQAQQQWENKPKEQQAEEKLSADLVKLQMLFNFPDKDTLIKASKQFDKLQTLFNLSKQFPALPAEWFSKMTSLKVLYLGKWESTDGRPRHIEVEDIYFLKALKHMKSLRLLSLQGISGIPKIPSTLGNLQNLEILDLRACHDLEKLPDRIGLLKNLTFLDLSECYLLDYIPKRLSQLDKLQVLKGFMIVDTKDTCTLDDLSNLENLRKLSINVNTTKFNLDVAENALVKFKKLAKLRIAWGSGGMPKDDPSPDNSSENQSKTKKQQPSSAAKASTGQENKGEEQGNELNSTTTKPEDNNKQNTGVSDQDKKKQRVRFRPVGTMVLAASRMGLPWNERKPQDPKGLENLVKLDLQCYPHSAPPKWLVPSKMVSLTNLSIRGGKLGHLVHESHRKWKVDTLRLKFLVSFKMNWKEMQERFPNLKYLENVRSPRITFCPCDANGVWQSSSNFNV